MQGFRLHSHGPQRRFQALRIRQIVLYREHPLHEVEFKTVHSGHFFQLPPDERLLHGAVHIHDSVDRTMCRSPVHKTWVQRFRLTVSVAAATANGSDVPMIMRMITPGLVRGRHHPLRTHRIHHVFFSGMRFLGMCFLPGSRERSCPTADMALRVAFAPII